MTELSNQKIIKGRGAVDAYREAHRLLHANGWYKGISEDHTPLLKKLVADLERIGVTSEELEVEPKKTKILAKFWAESDEQNVKDAGLEGKELAKDDRAILAEMWK